MTFAFLLDSNEYGLGELSATPASHVRHSIHITLRENEWSCQRYITGSTQPSTGLFIQQFASS